MAGEEERPGEPGLLFGERREASEVLDDVTGSHGRAVVDAGPGHP